MIKSNYRKREVKPFNCAGYMDWDLGLEEMMIIKLFFNGHFLPFWHQRQPAGQQQQQCYRLAVGHM